jgi:hypothetical protein
MFKTRLLLTGALLCVSSAGFAADTETADIPEGVLAKMARINAKQGADRDGSGDGESLRERRKSNPSCGSLNVGNVDMGNRRIGAPVREVTVIVKGDVINANNKCR